MNDKSMWGGETYDRLMGRWSRLLAPIFIRFAKVRDGERVLDVGCGTGSLTRALLQSGPNIQVTAMDGSADYVAINREITGTVRAEFDQGDAQALPYLDSGFDSTISLLVMNFIPDATRALIEMKRVTRKGGTIAAAVWDYGDGMEMLRILWDEVSNMDAGAAGRHERNMPLCRKGELAALWAECDLKSVTETALTIRMDFSSFDDYWSPFLAGPGPSGSYVSSLDGVARAKLADRLRDRLAGGSDETPFSLSAKAWAVRGRVAD